MIMRTIVLDISRNIAFVLPAAFGLVTSATALELVLSVIAPLVSFVDTIRLVKVVDTIRLVKVVDTIRLVKVVDTIRLVQVVDTIRLVKVVDTIHQGGATNQAVQSSNRYCRCRVVR